MSKHAAPPVTLRDVLAALPAVDRPLLWRISFYPHPKGVEHHTGAVELCLVRADSTTVVFKRWGAPGSSKNVLTLFGPLLVASYEAHGFATSMSADELVRLASWEVSMLGFKGGEDKALQ